MELENKITSINIEQETNSLIDALNRVQAIIEFKLDGTILNANSNFLSCVEYSLDEIVGKHHRIFCEPSYSSKPEYKAFWEKLGRGEFDQGEYKRITKSGKEIWINASYNPIFDASGKPIKIVKFATDITASKMYSSECKAKIDSLNRVQAVIEFKLDGTILNANTNFLNGLEYSLEEIVGKHHRIFCEPSYSSKPEYKAFWEKLGRGEFDQGEYKRITKSGKEIWINASYNPVFDASGKPIKIVKFATDITASKMYSSESKAKLDAISKAQATIEFDMNGIILNANDNFLQTSGYSLEEIKGQHHRIFCIPEYTKSNEYLQFWERLKKGEFEAGEFKRLGKNSREFWINASYNPIFDMNGKPFKITKFAVNITIDKMKNAEFEGKFNSIASFLT
jgi:methyl-accepting chemotaxis protein